MFPVKVGDFELPFKVYDAGEKNRPGIESSNDLSVVMWGEIDCDADDGGIRGESHEERMKVVKFIVNACNSHYKMINLLQMVIDCHTLSTDEYEQKYSPIATPMEFLVRYIETELEEIRGGPQNT